jgi:hypothetical protein
MEFNPTKIAGLDFTNDDNELDYFYTLQIWDVTTRLNFLRSGMK